MDSSLPRIALSLSYIKEFSVDEQGVFLHSLNPNYRPIRINNNYPFKIFGKVLGSSNTKKVTILQIKFEDLSYTFNIISLILLTLLPNHTNSNTTKKRTFTTVKYNTYFPFCSGNALTNCL